jgi:serine/threonine-protein kinase
MSEPERSEASDSERGRQARGSAGLGGADVQVGSRLGPYALEAIIAEGGFGTVFRARGGPRGCAAVKLLHAELAGSPEALARFAREVDVLGRVRHPGIAEVLDVGRADDGRPWFAMELLDGVDLDRHIAQRGRLTPGAALDILEPICDALATAHDAGVIHRDIKASNVFLAADGRVVLLDFGIAKLIDPVAGGGLTLSRQSLGTPSAMAPEQIAGRAATERTDVYGLGALLYHMLVGEPAFAAEGSATSMQYLHCHARRPRPSARASLPPAIDDVVTTAMSIEPDRRYAGARELSAASRAALVGQASGAHPVSALAVRVDVRVEPDADELGPAFDDAEAVWSAARAHFCTRGFVPALEASESMLFVRPHAPDAGSDGVAEFERMVTDRAGRHPAVSVAVLSKSGDVSFAGKAPLAGSLLAIQDW